MYLILSPCMLLSGCRLRSMIIPFQINSISTKIDNWGDRMSSTRVGTHTQGPIKINAITRIRSHWCPLFHQAKISILEKTTPTFNDRQMSYLCCIYVFVWHCKYHIGTLTRKSLDKQRYMTEAEGMRYWLIASICSVQGVTPSFIFSQPTNYSSSRYVRLNPRICSVSGENYHYVNWHL